MHHAREVICLDRCSPSSASSSCFSSCAGSSRMAVAAECPVVLPRVPGKSVWKRFPPSARRKTADPFGKALRSRHACVSLPFPRCLDPGSGSPVHVPRPVVSCDGLFCLRFSSPVVMGPVLSLSPSFASPVWSAAQPPDRVFPSAVGFCLLFHLPSRMLKPRFPLYPEGISAYSILWAGVRVPVAPSEDGDLPYRPERSFFGVGGGTGEEGAVFTKNAPSSPAIPVPARMDREGQSSYAA